MKKSVIISIIFLLIIVSIVVCSFLLNNNSNYNYSETVYQKTLKKSDLTNNVSLQSENLKVTLRGFYPNGITKENFDELVSKLNVEAISFEDIKGKDNIKKHDTILEFSTMDNTSIKELSFDYLVYDNSGNIITTSILGVEEPFNNEFIKKFVKKEYNSDEGYSEYTKHMVWDGLECIYYISNSDNVNYKLISLHSDLDDTNSESNNVNLDCSKVHILIANPSYKTSESDEKITLQENTIFEFIIED